MLLGRLKRRWEKNIKMNLKETREWEVVAIGPGL
jgi:hypothetical protein